MTRCSDTEVELRPTSRIELLKADVMSRVSPFAHAHGSHHGSWIPSGNPWARNVALHRAWQPGMSIGQIRAATLLELVRLSEVEIFPGWRLAGEHLTGQQFAAPADPRFADARQRLGEFGLAEGEIVTLADELSRWHLVTRGGHSEVGRAAFDRGPEERDQRGNTVYIANGWMENHSIRDYPKLLRIGYSGIREEIQARLSEADLADPEFPRKEAAWRAGLLVCDAGVLLGERYAQLAKERADDCAGTEERERLTTMADVCEQVPSRGARTLREAVQALWLGHILTCGEDGINANSIGRLDQFLDPYYQTDLEAGGTTRDEAVEMMAELACKLYLDYDVQAITLAGRDAAGNDLTNDMTGIILEATEQVGFIRDLSVRLHRESPRSLFRACARMVAQGGGIPFVFNDDCFIPALVSHGIAPEHAGDYAPIGCVELTIPGKANPHAVSGWFHIAKCLELALFNGEDPVSGRSLGPETGGLVDFTDYEGLRAAYRAQVEHFAQRMVYLCNRGELRQREGGPLPCWSILTDDCIERGRDITDGGPLYNYHSVCLLGTANVADSLCAIRKLVFEQGRVGAGDLLRALREDFEGHEPLRQLLLHEAPKYGNGIDEVDVIAREVADHFIDLMDQARSPLNGRYVVHLFSFLLNIGFGKALGATPDGRRAGQPIAYSLSAQQGRDENGVTAMLHSLAKLPHRRAAGASAAIVDLDPKLVQGESGVERLTELLQTAIAMGVGQLQMNVTTSERLQKARSDPERFGNIPVRVAGYSQLFKLLSPDLQDHVIARTKHRS